MHAKVGDLGSAGGVKQDVAGLQIAVNHQRVQIRQSCSHVMRHLRCRFPMSSKLALHTESLMNRALSRPLVCSRGVVRLPPAPDG